MKKVVALILAGVLTLGASMTAFATPSPSGNITGTTSDGQKVTVSQNYATSEEEKAAADLKAAPAATLESVVGAEEAKDMNLAAVFDASVENYQGGQITITFTVPGVTASSKVIVLHYTGGKWQKEAPTMGAGTVTVTFQSLSPVAIYVDSTASAAGKTGVSPKTGSAPVMPIVAVVAVIAVAGMAVSTRRKHA